MLNNLVTKKYPKDSAGALMTDKVPLAYLEDNISSVEKYLKKKKEKLDSINYIYVINKKGILKGVASIKEIFRQKQNRLISEFVDKKLIVAKPFSKGEFVANLALENSIKSVPIVDRKGKFLGVVSSDTILNIVNEEIHEDLSLLAGVSIPEKISDSSSLSTFKSLKNRIPWLIIGMLGGFLMSKTIDSFHATLAENIIIASFIPLIVYMGAAVQTQIGFLIVRDLAFNPKLKFFFYSLRQLRVVFFISLIMSFLVFGIAFLFYRDLLIVTILSIAMFLAILSSIITGVLIPFIFHYLKFDPASASGPVATTFQDLTSIVIYLLVAQSLL